MRRQTVLGQFAVWVGFVACGTGFADGPKAEVAPPPREVKGDSTGGRNLRWVLRFRVTSGRDYVEQLAVLNAKILIPTPDAETKAILFPDLKKPDTRRELGEKEIREFADHLKFADSRREAVGGVAQALGLDFTPKTFFAFFPRDFEEELARKERAYRDRRVEDIEQTIFRITMREGKVQVEVEEQTAKSDKR